MRETQSERAQRSTTRIRELLDEQWGGIPVRARAEIEKALDEIDGTGAVERRIRELNRGWWPQNYGPPLPRPTAKEQEEIEAIEAAHRRLTDHRAALAATPLWRVFERARRRRQLAAAERLWDKRYWWPLADSSPEGQL